MGKMKQLALDIIENQSEQEDDVVYSFPNHAIVPTKDAVFDCEPDPELPSYLIRN